MFSPGLAIKRKKQHPICQTHFEGRHTGPWDACDTIASEKHLHVEWVTMLLKLKFLGYKWHKEHLCGSLCHCLPTCLCSVCLDPNIWGNDMTWMQVLWQSRKWTESMKFKKNPTANVGGEEFTPRFGGNADFFLGRKHDVLMSCIFSINPYTELLSNWASLSLFWWPCEFLLYRHYPLVI